MAVRMKQCRDCNRLLPETSFYKDKGKYLQSYCKECRNKRRNAWAKTEKGKRSSKKHHLWQNYGMSIGEHERMYAVQDGRCGVCGQLIPYSEVQVDHDHNIGAVRGMVCRSCNCLLGHFENDPIRVQQCLQWLGRS